MEDKPNQNSNETGDQDPKNNEIESYQMIIESALEAFRKDLKEMGKSDEEIEDILNKFS